jgi:hypothetical protein
MNGENGTFTWRELWTRHNHGDFDQTLFRSSPVSLQSSHTRLGQIFKSGDSFSSIR